MTKNQERTAYISRTTYKQPEKKDNIQKINSGNTDDFILLVMIGGVILIVITAIVFIPPNEEYTNNIETLNNICKSLATDESYINYEIDKNNNYSLICYYENKYKIYRPMSYNDKKE